MGWVLKTGVLSSENDGGEDRSGRSFIVFFSLLDKRGDPNHLHSDQLRWFLVNGVGFWLDGIDPSHWFRLILPGVSPNRPHGCLILGPAEMWIAGREFIWRATRFVVTITSRSASMLPARFGIPVPAIQFTSRGNGGRGIAIAVPRSSVDCSSGIIISLICTKFQNPSTQESQDELYIFSSSFSGGSFHGENHRHLWELDFHRKKQMNLYRTSDAVAFNLILLPVSDSNTFVVPPTRWISTPSIRSTIRRLRPLGGHSPNSATGQSQRPPASAANFETFPIKPAKLRLRSSRSFMWV